MTDYERLHQAANQPIESTDSKISTLSDGTIFMKFNHSNLKPSSSKSLPTISMMQVPVEHPS